MCLSSVQTVKSLNICWMDFFLFTFMVPTWWILTTLVNPWLFLSCHAQDKCRNLVENVLIGVKFVADDNPETKSLLIPWVIKLHEQNLNIYSTDCKKILQMICFVQTVSEKSHCWSSDDLWIFHLYDSLEISTLLMTMLDGQRDGALTIRPCRSCMWSNYT